MAKTLEDDVAEAFAVHFPFTAKAILRLYQRIKSWDMVDGICSFALAEGFTDLSHAYNEWQRIRLWFSSLNS